MVKIHNYMKALCQYHPCLGWFTKIELFKVCFSDYVILSTGFSWLLVNYLPTVTYYNCLIITWEEN